MNKNIINKILFINFVFFNLCLSAQLAKAPVPKPEQAQNTPAKPSGFFSKIEAGIKKYADKIQDKYNTARLQNIQAKEFKLKQQLTSPGNYNLTSQGISKENIEATLTELQTRLTNTPDPKLKKQLKQQEKLLQNLQNLRMKKEQLKSNISESGKQTAGNWYEKKWYQGVFAGEQTKQAKAQKEIIKKDLLTGIKDTEQTGKKRFDQLEVLKQISPSTIKKIGRPEVKISENKLQSGQAPSMLLPTQPTEKPKPQTMDNELQQAFAKRKAKSQQTQIQIQTIEQELQRREQSAQANQRAQILKERSRQAGTQENIEAQAQLRQSPATQDFLKRIQQKQTTTQPNDY